MAIKHADIGTLREMGVIQEANRVFFHPLGLALEVTSNEGEPESISGIWDCMDDPEGVLYGEIDQEKRQKFNEFAVRQHTTRKKTVGFVIEE